MPTEPTGNLAQATKQTSMLIRKGEYHLALEQVDEILALYPSDMGSLFLKGAIQRRLGNYKDAERLLRRVVKKVPNLASVQEELGRVMHVQGKMDIAKVHLHKAVKLNKKLITAWNLLGQIYAIEGQDEKAEHARRQQLIADNKDPALVKAVELVQEGKLGVAEGICRKYLLSNPDDVSALQLLADIGIQLGMAAEALAMLERCLELAPDYHQARNSYAKALSRLHKFEQALKETDFLEKAEPGNMSHPVLAAAIMANAGYFDRAIVKYEGILSQLPDNAPLQMSYGTVLKTVGRHEDSVIAYRKAIAAEPSLGEAYWNLSNLKTFRFQEAEIQAMKHWVEQPKLSHADRFHLCFALAKALEDAEDFDASFDYYRRGNELKKISMNYSAEETHEKISSAIQHCSSALFEAKKNYGDPSPEPIFIVGLPRSGSTLLEQILASHSQVEGTAELPYILHIAQRLRGTKRKKDISKYPQNLWDLNPEQCRALGQEYLASAQTQRSGTGLFIDKMPNNFEHIGLIRMILPNAKIIDARRHPLATCFSGFKQLFASGQEFTYGLDDIGRYYSDYLRLMAHWNHVLPGAVLLVEYENVVNDFEMQVCRLLDHCGLAFEPACLEFYSSERAVRTASSEQVRQPIYAEALEQWRNFESHLDPLKQALTGE